MNTSTGHLQLELLQPPKVAFAQDDDWEKKAICNECGEKGHIRPKCPKLQEDDSDDEEDDDEKEKEKEAQAKKAAKEKEKKKKKKKKKLSFAQVDEEDSDDTSDDEFQFVQLAHSEAVQLVNPEHRADVDLRTMILLDNQSTTDLFCNRKLVSNVWGTPTNR